MTKTEAPYQIPHRQLGKGNKEYYFTPELEQKFIEIAATTPATELARLFGVSASWIRKRRMDYGIKSHRSILMKKVAPRIVATSEERGVYDKRRGKPLPQACYDSLRKKFDNGFNPMDIFKAEHLEEYKAMLRNKSERYRALIAKERKRLKYGLPQRSNIHLPQFSYNVKEKSRRANAGKYGYILGNPSDDSGERFTLFYDEETKRSPRFEANSIKAGFLILPYKEKTPTFHFIH